MAVIAASVSPRKDTAYRVALAAIVVTALGELLATAFHFAGQSRRQHAAAQPANPPGRAATATPTSASTPEPASSVVPSSAALSAPDRLLNEARVLRGRGDTANALARLQEASQRDPRNAEVLAEMASIYESIQLYDRSNETWRKIQEIGPSAGQIYELADKKLRIGPGASVGGAAVPTTDAGGKPIDAEGIPEGSMFGVADISTEEVPDPESETNLRLRIAIKARQNATIDHSKLRIVVLFYDLLDDGTIAPTDAEVSYEWMGPKHDWSESNPETLLVTYLRPKTHGMSDAALSAAAAGVSPSKGSARAKKRSDSTGSSASEQGGRKYLGYVVRILYDDKLQTVRADPPRLLTDAPTSFSSP
jgi:tetratricopeptide (TPR) repeat protein